MAIPHGEQQSIAERSILGAAIGLEFECSFAAAEANKAATQLLDQRVELRSRDAGRGEHSHIPRRSPPFQQLDIIGEELDLQKTEVIDLQWHPLIAEQPVKIALLQPRRTINREITGRTKLLRRLVRSQQEEETLDNPILAAMFGDVALPLASFSRRKDGNCSYVQLGSEIKDDNFHVMASDDQTGRNVVIEAVRDALNPGYAEGLLRPDHKSNQTESQRKVALEKLLAIECRQNSEQLTAAFEAQLVRRCVAKLSPGTWRTLTVFNDQGERSEQRFSRSVMVDRTRLSDDRIAHLMIGAPIEGDNQDMAQLLAVTRGKLAISVATLNAATGQIAFENADIKPNSERRKQIVYQLLSIARGEPLVRHGRDDKIEWIFDDDMEPELKSKTKGKNVTAKLKAAMGKEAIGAMVNHIRYDLISTEQDKEIINFFEHEDRNNGLFAHGELPDVGQAFINEVVGPIRGFLENPLLAPNPYPNSPIMQVAARRLNKENSVRENILDQFNVQARFADILGTTSVDEEAMVNQLFNLLLQSTTHKGIIRNLSMTDITKADAVVQVEIEVDGPAYTVTVSGKPDAMDDEPLKPLPTFCFELDSARPIQPQLNGKNDSIQVLRGTLKALKPVV